MYLVSQDEYEANKSHGAAPAAAAVAAPLAKGTDRGDVKIDVSHGGTIVIGSEQDGGGGQVSVPAVSSSSSSSSPFNTAAKSGGKKKRGEAMGKQQHGHARALLHVRRNEGPVLDHAAPVVGNSNWSNVEPPVTVTEPVSPVTRRPSTNLRRAAIQNRTKIHQRERELMNALIKKRLAELGGRRMSLSHPTTADERRSRIDASTATENDPRGDERQILHELREVSQPAIRQRLNSDDEPMPLVPGTVARATSTGDMPRPRITFPSTTSSSNGETAVKKLYPESADWVRRRSRPNLHAVRRHARPVNVTRPAALPLTLEPMELSAPAREVHQFTARPFSLAHQRRLRGYQRRALPAPPPSNKRKREMSLRKETAMKSQKRHAGTRFPFEGYETAGVKRAGAKKHRDPFYYEPETKYMNVADRPVRKVGRFARIKRKNDMQQFEHENVDVYPPNKLDRIYVTNGQ